MRKKTSVLVLLLSALVFSFLPIKALNFDNNVVNTIKTYETNLKNYAEGQQWFYEDNSIVADIGESDEELVYADKDEPLGKIGSNDFSYYSDIESNAYYQIYDTGKEIYIVHWSANGTVSNITIYAK